MLNVNGIAAMTMIEEDGTSVLIEGSQRLTEDIGDLECLLVEAAG